VSTELCSAERAGQQPIWRQLISEFVRPRRRSRRRSARSRRSATAA